MNLKFKIHHAKQVWISVELPTKGMNQSVREAAQSPENKNVQISQGIIIVSIFTCNCNLIMNLLCNILKVHS